MCELLDVEWKNLSNIFKGLITLIQLSVLLQHRLQPKFKIKEGHACSGCLLVCRPTLRLMEEHTLQVTISMHVQSSFIFLNITNESKKKVRLLTTGLDVEPEFPSLPLPCCFSSIFFPLPLWCVNTWCYALQQNGDWLSDNREWWQSICVSLRPPGLRVSVDTKWEWQRKGGCDPGVTASAPCCTKKVY